MAAVARLLRSSAAADRHQPLGDHRWLDPGEGERHGITSFVAREQGRPPPIGYAQVQRTGSSFAIEVVVEPAWRTPEGAVAAELLGAALDAVGRAGGGAVQWWVPQAGPVEDHVAQTAGLSKGRDLYQMRRALPVGTSEAPLTTRRFEPGRDEQAFLWVNNRAFSWHPEQGGWDTDTVLGREREPWFDPEGFLLHERDGRLAGFCWTKVHRDEDPPLGEIYVIAVDPDFQGLGLGRRLVLAGLSFLADAGLRVGMLYVDATNVAAVRLYTTLGFDLHHIDRAYTAEVPAATGPK